MKIGIDLGHGCNYDGGAVGIIKEEEIINTVGNKVITKLRTDKFDSVNEMIKSLPKKAKIYLSRGKKYKCIAQKM